MAVAVPTGWVSVLEIVESGKRVLMRVKEDCDRRDSNSGHQLGRLM